MASADCYSLGNSFGFVENPNQYANETRYHRFIQHEANGGDTQLTGSYRLSSGTREISIM